MKCKKCSSKMYLNERGQGTTGWICPNCGNSFYFHTDSFEPPTSLINPAKYTADELYNKIYSGEIGLNQIPYPERINIESKLNQK
ncbi:hypothetical protein ND861_19565 [Leptospira sp. 2 VSF19]|uniref:Uncharacterized protein n=1 Tax=Leptospira soteropolitanensis TaxID=2950025 RepID=A0AAW5VU45_9LEPT|nr:hypothetical protein [Leptospira soteropolitanensis]MCW7494874.1 hypothetical protein [Leptospira soteropolitanensis]MCW7502431.1 hypothetical protein [Leptospira soteropolitanensis]MCW7524694.1 hypothetical protein [Leptospira soteropolitanensis]MCW7528564.1 hypothetical protein [Leptospira soteropolitanensis]MCW7532412.1 hypothetical protein [Leptospira soteropolitanensis]